MTGRSGLRYVCAALQHPRFYALFFIDQQPFTLRGVACILANGVDVMCNVCRVVHR